MSGTIGGQLGQVQDAVQSLRRAIELSPNYFEAHANLGGLLQNQGDLQGARAALFSNLLDTQVILHISNGLHGMYLMLLAVFDMVHGDFFALGRHQQFHITGCKIL